MLCSYYDVLKLIANNGISYRQLSEIDMTVSSEEMSYRVNFTHKEHVSRLSLRIYSCSGLKNIFWWLVVSY